MDVPPGTASDHRPWAATVPRRPPVVHDLHPAPESLYDDVRAGLSRLPRSLPCKYFYDETGAQLFDRITELEAYYPTRTELGILRRHLPEIADLIGPRARLVEFGSGSGLKTRLLLRHLHAPAAYVPVDISRAQLREFALSLAAELPGLDIRPICADYTADWAIPSLRGATRTVAFFPGSTIGNFEEAEAAAFLARVRTLCGPGGALLIGVDLAKDRVTLERAYDDPQGITAEFNLNLLRRINRECGADFDVEAFRHHALYDEERRRIEMRLVASRATAATLPARNGTGPATFRFRPGDFIRTEYSHKYTPADFHALASAAGWVPAHVWTDERPWFSVWLLNASE